MYYPIENEDFFIAMLVYQRVIVNIKVMLFGLQWNVANKKHEDIYIYPKETLDKHSDCAVFNKHAWSKHSGFDTRECLSWLIVKPLDNWWNTTSTSLNIGMFPHSVWQSSHVKDVKTMKEFIYQNTCDYLWLIHVTWQVTNAIEGHEKDPMLVAVQKREAKSSLKIEKCFRNLQLLGCNFNESTGIFVKKTNLPKFFRNYLPIMAKEFSNFPGDFDGSATTTATDGDVQCGHGLWTSVLPWLFALWLGQCRETRFFRQT